MRFFRAESTRGRRQEAASPALSLHPSVLQPFSALWVLPCTHTQVYTHMHTQNLPVFPTAKPAVLHLSTGPLPDPARDLAGKPGQAGSKMLLPEDLLLRPSLEAGRCFSAALQFLSRWSRVCSFSSQQLE